MRTPIWIGCLFVLLLSLGGTAQELPVLRPIHIPEVRNIPLHTVVSIHGGEDGYLWIGGIYGLYRYDGVSLELFENDPADPQSITYGGLNNITPSRRGGFWLGSASGGISYFDPVSREAVSYLHHSTDSLSLSSNQVAGILEDRHGDLWVGAAGFSLQRLRHGAGTFESWRPQMPELAAEQLKEHGGLGEMLEDPTDADLLWIGCRFGLLEFHKPTGHFTLHPFPMTVRFWYRPHPVQLQMSPDGALWVGSYETGLLRYDLQTCTWQKWERPVDDKFYRPAFNVITEILPYNDRWLVAATLFGDLVWIDWRTQAVTFRSTWASEASPSVDVHALHASAGGDLWLGTVRGLVWLTQKPAPFDFHRFPSFSMERIKNNWQRSALLSADSCYLYIGTFRGDGLLRWDWAADQTTCYRYRSTDHPDSTDVWMDALCSDERGRIWIGSDGGLLVLEPGADRVRAAREVFPAAAALDGLHLRALGRSGDTLWIGTAGKGLFFLDLTHGRLQQPPELPPALQYVTRILPDQQGRLWLGSQEGLFLLPAGRSPWQWFARHASGRSNGLSHEYVSDLAFDRQGRLWIATLGGGLTRLETGAGGEASFTYYINRAVQGGNVIHELQIHPNGQIWLHTDSGISWLDTTSASFVNYDYRDGMYAKYGSLQVLPNGYLISGANRGFDYFHPDTLRRLEDPPIPYFRRFRVFDEEVELADRIDLNHQQNHFAFEFGARNFNPRAINTFAYQLEGYDADWVFAGERDYVSYTNLPAGRYRFRLRASNRHNSWSPHVSTLNIVIRPPFWQTWWFRFTGVAALAGLGWLLWRQLHERQIRRTAQRAIDYFAHSTYPYGGLDDLLWDLVRNCISRLQLEDCVVYLLDSERNVLVQKAAYGPKNPRALEILNPIEIPVGQGIVGSAAAKGVPELITDTARDPRYIPDDEVRLSELAVPIVHEGEVIGVIDSEHSRRGFFKPYHVNLLSTIAGLCAHKIAKARAELAVQEKEKQLLELDKHLAETQLIALRAQMNPHFLFNCLNSINWYIIKNRQREASRYLTRFSRLIRLILDHSKSTQISLERELEALRLYIDMEAMRFEGRFSYAIDIDERIDAETVSIPPLILQPYVENAIWHGLMPSPREGRLHISLAPENGHLRCVIEDNGIGREASQALRAQSVVNRESQGMNITARRITMLHQEVNVETPVEIIDLYDAAGAAAGTCVVLNLPLP